MAYAIGYRSFAAPRLPDSQRRRHNFGARRQSVSVVGALDLPFTIPGFAANNIPLSHKYFVPNISLRIVNTLR
jgi:hypothetical protein